MDNKRFKKQFKVLVETTDRGNALVMEPGTKGFVILSDITGKFKVCVKIEDLQAASSEVTVLHSVYLEENEKTPEKPIEGDFDINDVGYGDEELN